ncbi:MAG: hypothetical protein R3Y43_02490 [Alphaproteobacteria bacterium]
MKKNINILIIYIFIGLFGYINNLYSFGIPPQDFEEMYKLAQKGNLYALKAAEGRGLDINSKNKKGNTGICEAIIRNSIKAYNTFYAAGANTQAPCVYQIEKKKYARFMDSRFILERQALLAKQKKEGRNWFTIPENNEVAEAVTNEIGKNTLRTLVNKINMIINTEINSYD